MPRGINQHCDFILAEGVRLPVLLRPLDGAHGVGLEKAFPHAPVKERLALGDALVYHGSSQTLTQVDDPFLKVLGYKLHHVLQFFRRRIPDNVVEHETVGFEGAGA